MCIDPDTGQSIRDSLTEYVKDVPIQCLLTDSKGCLWICTYGDGVIAVNPDKTKTRYSEGTGLFGDQTRMAVELSDSRIAICGNDGLSFLASDGTVEDTLVRQTGSAPVMCLTEEDNGTLLAGTEGDGISFIRDGKIEKNLTMADGLTSDTVRRISISPETGRIYAVTNNGIDLISRDGTDYSVKKLKNQSGANCKKHVDYGAEILSNFTGLDHVVEGAQYHHERYDGKGYTHGLKGEEIPLYGRIIGVADAFDAMTSNRVYREHLDIEKVLSELERCKGSQFDPGIADIMIRIVKEGKIKG
ncbi:MAG: HD domain-containing phosphohydrolase [Eubacterium sp.]|nr:HD domain-containing phosphohydrolase [Eubacterium sp.]